MRTRLAVLSGLTVLLLSGLPQVIAAEAPTPPTWAYPVNPPDFRVAPDDGTPRQVPGSSERYSTSQVRDRFIAPDWHPGDHPAMPAVVASGRRPDVSACGFCHRAEGTGGPENASLAGLPAGYLMQQMLDYRSGARSTAVPKRAPQVLMIAAAKAMTDDEMRAAAAYFASLKLIQNIRVVESDTVPVTFVAGWFLGVKDPSMREPLGQRIIEVPDQLDQFESRDGRATFTAYVPPASIRRGQALVSGQDGTRVPACAGCHGADLHGIGDIPPIAGRSPTYVFRQLYEMQAGVRAGTGATLMKDTVAKLDETDMIAIAAYLGTLKP